MTQVVEIKHNLQNLQNLHVRAHVRNLKKH